SLEISGRPPDVLGRQPGFKCTYDTVAAQTSFRHYDGHDGDRTFSESASVFLWSCILALVLFLACEAPVGRLDKILWTQSSLKKKEEQVNGRNDLELPTHPSEALEGTN
ncbi:hypothetical protein MTO96_030172, partial [Rhipicephalus appendiculatus]